MKGRKKRIKRRYPKRGKFQYFLIFLFSIMVFLILFVTMLLIGGTAYFLIQQGIINLSPGLPGISLFLLGIGCASVLVGTILSGFIVQLPLKPVDRIIYGLNRLAGGKYDTRIHLGYTKLGKELAQSFNLLAEELQGTEMLRSDFINNFSHEFKTPLVSILGFAKLLKRGDLSEQQQEEYLDIIEEEAARLTKMATNVLDMTKVENQNILTGVSEFNLSEQIRNGVLLLEKKWSEKHLDMQLAFREYMISGNEGMLKQVWINLLDNAIKFSPEGGTVVIDIQKTKEEEKKKQLLQVSVTNSGETIAEKDLPFIMNKFYQADVSHSQEGNGLGLALVKKIVELHKGQVTVESAERETTFTVELPLQEEE